MSGGIGGIPGGGQPLDLEQAAADAAAEVVASESAPASGAPAAGGTRDSVMLNLAAPAGTPPPGDDAPSRTGTEVAIGNPLTDHVANAKDYAAISSAVGFGLDKLAEKFPDVDKGFAARFLEMAISTGAQVPLMVYSHEAGHAADASAAGGDPQIQMTGFASGLTTYNLPQGADTPQEDMVIDAAGVNQEQQNAQYMFEKFAQNGGARYQEAMGYLLAQTNTALYALRTVSKEAGAGQIASSDDIENYIQQLNANGNKITTGQLAAISAATDLLSAPVWASLIGQVRFLASGSRDVAMPTISIGDVKATFPNLHTLLSTNGPIVGGQVMIDPDKKIPVEVSFDARIDTKAAAAVGLKLMDVPLGTDRVTVNPWIRGTYDERTGVGYAVGADVKAEIAGGVAATASVSYSHNDLLGEPTGEGDGVNATVGISIPF